MRRIAGCIQQMPGVTLTAVFSYSYDITADTVPLAYNWRL